MEMEVPCEIRAPPRAMKLRAPRPRGLIAGAQAPRPPSQTRTPVPRDGGEADLAADDDSLIVHVGGVVSNFGGLRLLRKFKAAQYLDEDRLIQHENNCAQDAAGSSETAMWLKYIKGARARAQAEAGMAYETFCQLTIPEFSNEVAKFIRGDSFSEDAPGTIAAGEEQDLPETDLRDTYSNGSNSSSTPRRAFRNSFRDNMDHFSRVGAVLEGRSLPDSADEVRERLSFVSMDSDRFDIFDAVWLNSDP